MPSSAKNVSFVLLIAAMWIVPSLADPPAHAPAHGWRKKQSSVYVGRTGAQWDQDFGVASGKCNRDTIAAVVGGVVGGVLANRIGDEHRAVATLIGVTAGALIGHRIGRELDERDRSCVGHALEIGESGRPISWANEATGVQYELIPGADRQRDGAACRQFTLKAAYSGERESRTGLACQSRPGEWQIVN